MQTRVTDWYNIYSNTVDINEAIKTALQSNEKAYYIIMRYVL